MESAYGWEQRTLINELTQGMELAKQLRTHLNSSASSVETREFLVQKILSSYEKALLVLNWSGSAVVHPLPMEPTKTSLPESPMSFDGSPRSDDLNPGFTPNQGRKDASKKRKVMPKRKDHVRVSSESGLEGPVEDGYSWRKYGQKDILGAKYPRSYYRCTYRHMRDCWATKMVQRSDEEPTMFEVTYKGKHTCSQTSHPIPALASPDKQEQKQNAINMENKQLQPNEVLMNFRANLSVNTEDLDNKEMISPFSFPPTSLASVKSNHDFYATAMPEDCHIMGSYSPSFISPATSESNYLTVSPCGMRSSQMVHNMHHSEADPAEIFSADTSAADSPILDMDFSLDPVDFGSFPFDNPGFFS